jgi:hypothetical protein
VTPALFHTEAVSLLAASLSARATVQAPPQDEAWFDETTDGAPTPAREPTQEEGREFAGDFEIEDAQGNKFEPIPLPASNIFAYRARPLKKGDCIPASGSTAFTAPTAGALLVFRIPVAATENRPLELSVSVGGETKHFELDI